MSLFGLFLEGLLSFLSPCVIPMLPLYMSYLSSDLKEVQDDGSIKYNTLKVFINTLFFVLGISVIFFVLALSINSISPFIENYQEIISIIGGTILIIFGLSEIGLININFLNINNLFKVNINLKQMNYLKAFLLGFLFSISYSPCIGPLLSSAIIIAASKASGYLYILVYGLGLVLPFLITGLFTGTILKFLNNKKKFGKYIMIIAGIILIIYGGNMIYSSSKTIIEYKNNASSKDNTTTIDVLDVIYYDQDGNEINLKSYNGKYVMLNFIATWCTYCMNEIPDYVDYATSNNDDVICLYVMSPSSSNVSKDDLIKFIKEKGIDIPVIIDENSRLFTACGVSAFPTLYIIDKNSEFLGYAQGMLDLEGFNSLMEQVKQDS